MKHVVIIGAGTAGTVTANSLVRRLDARDFTVTVVEPRARHYYEPGLVSMSFKKSSIPITWRWLRRVLHPQVRLVRDRVINVDPHLKTVITKSGVLHYDFLVVATGCAIRPDLVPGVMQVDRPSPNIYTFYTLAGMRRLRPVLRNMKHGKLVIHISEFPIRCSVAPIEFALMADYFFFNQRCRDDIEIQIVTPQSQVFQQRIAAQYLANILRHRDIEVKPDFVTHHVDPSERRLYSYDGKTVDYDLLVTIPPVCGAQFVTDSKLGDEMGFMHPDIHTLQHKEYPDVFVVGDASELPTSKSGSAAVYQSRIVVENLLDRIEGRELSHRYDGHTICLLDTGFHKAVALDLNYKVPAVTGKLFVPRLGPLSLLKETRLNFLAKRLMLPFYWLLMAGPKWLRNTNMHLAGKQFSRWGLRVDGASLDPLPKGGKFNKQWAAPTYKRHPNACLAAAFNVKVLELPVVKEAAGVPISTDDEGFMLHPEQWSREIGADLANKIKLEMTDRHWEVVEFARSSFYETGVSPGLRRFEMVGKIPVEELFELFHFKPSKVIAFISGIPKPSVCI